MRKIPLDFPLAEDYVNVWYDAITKHQDPGGMPGLRKINKLIDLFDSIGTLNPVRILCADCAKGLGTGIDRYTLDPDFTFVWMDDELWKYILQSYDKVQWTSMRAKIIANSYDYLASILEAKPEPTPRTVE